jgi:hypothetical protein
MSPSPACIHHFHDEKIHEYTFTEISRRALDEMFATIEEVLTDAEKNNPGEPYKPALVDSRIGIQPLNYAFQRMRPLVNRYPGIERVRIALIVPPTPLLSAVSKILHTVTPMHFYKPTEREQALAWLLERSEAISKLEPR